MTFFVVYHKIRAARRSFGGAAVPFLTMGRKAFLPPEFYERGGLIAMLTYGDIISTVAIIVSIARFVFEMIKYNNEQKRSNRFTLEK